MEPFNLDLNNISESVAETQAIPFSLIVDKYRYPISKAKHKDVQFQIDSSTENQNIFNYDNNGYKYDSIKTSIHNDVGTDFLDSQYSSYLLSSAEKSINNEDINSNSKRKNETENKNKDTKYVHILDRFAPPRAVAVLPAALYLRRDTVVSRRFLPAKIKFGPVQGINFVVPKVTVEEMVQVAAKSNVPVLFKKNNEGFIHIDVSDQDKSNWFSLLPLGDQNSANVWIHHEDGELYGVTVRSIATRVPLILGYSKQYAEEFGIPPGQPVLDITEDLVGESRRWWCYDCERAFPSASLLQRHSDFHHKQATKIRRNPRARYRCRHCFITFSRLFSLKRHIAHYCSKKGEKPESKTADSVTEIDASLNIEDNRLPSDESLQNFTNGLDFSTSLFDTDRISSLDISGSLRSENDFNPYGLTGDESGLSTDIGYAQAEPTIVKNTDETRTSTPTPISISCSFCNQTIESKKKQQHFRECKNKRFKCECGRSYPNKERLAEHIHVHHASSVTPEKKTVADEQKSGKYKCDKCPLTYARRGMLVNHMWIVHHVEKITIPLERRVRYYPCVACPKLYRTASKRARHVHLHHPGVELVKGSTIEGGTRSCDPAACPACPRQYATRAKLLQHLRAVHPDMAPPLQKSTKSKK